MMWPFIIYSALPRFSIFPNDFCPVKQFPPIVVLVPMQWRVGGMWLLASPTRNFKIVPPCLRKRWKNALACGGSVGGMWRWTHTEKLVDLFHMGPAPHSKPASPPPRHLSRAPFTLSFLTFFFCAPTKKKGKKKK